MGEEDFWEEDKSWFRRHWILTIVLVFLVLGVIGSLFPEENLNITGNVINSLEDKSEDIQEEEMSIEEVEESEVSEDKSEDIQEEEMDEENVVNANPMDLLPNNEEIDTEWENIKRESRAIEASGFDSGAYLEMDRTESLSLSLAYVFIYKFDSESSAESFYSTEINKIKKVRGYSELSTSGIDATCFGYKGGDSYEGHHYIFYCKKENIFFSTEVDTFNLLRSGYSKELSEIVADKI